MAKSTKKKTTRKAASSKASPAARTAGSAKKKAAKTTKKKTASASSKKNVKKAPAKKAAAAKPAAPVKKATKKPSKKTTKKTTTTKKSKKKAPAARTIRKKTPTGSAARPAPAAKPKRPRVAARPPLAALSDPPRDAYDPHNHTPPTPAQLRKIKTGLTVKDLRAYRQLLLERRAEIIGDVQGLEAARSGNAGEISHMPLHMADVGSDNYEQEFTLGLMESERRIVIEIDEALQRLVDKTYGVCIESGVPIGRPRLDAKPWAKYCIEIARERERRGL
ncbi:MAG: TraR/DksA family transcriptional regulator [Planctomycetota bacterium]